MYRLVILFAIFLSTLAQTIIDKKPKKFEPSWDSLDTREMPSWYDQQKVGIFIHWGIYSVPSMGSEWFWTNWRTSHSPNYVHFMQKNFKPGYSYQEFAREFTAEHFNAREWSQIFVESGAKYVVLTSKHHDGYALWPSKYSFSWNSLDVGPKRDIIGELSNAIRRHTSLKFGLYHSLFEWFNPMYLEDKQNFFKTSEFVQKKVINEMMELIEHYQPEIFWSDGEWEASDDYWQSKEFLAWLYNESPVRQTVVVNDRWGNETLCKHGDFFTCADRFNPGVLQEHKWENAMTIDKESWGQRSNAKLEDFLTSQELIHELIITVSCGGNILINVGPTKYGTIEPIYVERLRSMGRWLQHNGEAIYESIPWKFQNDTETPGVWYTTKENTVNLRKIVYAIILEYPYDTNTIELNALGGLYDEDTQAVLLGYPEKLMVRAGPDSLLVEFPRKALIDKVGLHHAWTIRIDLPAEEQP